MAKKRQKVKKFSVQGFDNKHYKLTDQYTKAVDALFNKATNELAKSVANGKYNPLKPFAFDDYPKTKAVADKIISNLASNITTVIETGSRRQWLFANQKNDAFINSVVDTTQLTKAQLKKLQDRNLSALQSFQQRKIGGMGLSQRVWKYVGQYKDQIELGLDIGIGEGRSAAQISRDVRQNLKDPNRLFRRVRDKHGNLVLSKAAKAFNPGVGVYRSSAKNAMRLTRTEINMAYRESDWLRWQQLDFVIGFEVKRSNHDPLFDCKVCSRLVGKYPKAFKFRGWHPQCMCHATPIIEDYFSKARSNDRVNRLKAALNGTEAKKYVSTETVTDVPQGFKGWVAENAEKQANWRSTPYFIRDNFKNSNLADGLRYIKPIDDVPVKIKRVKTDAEKADIQRRWNTRLAINQYGESIDSALGEYDNVPSLQRYLNKIKKAIADGASMDVVDAMMNKFDHKVKVKEAWDERAENNQLGVLLDNVAAYKAQFGLQSLKHVYKAVEDKLANWANLSLEEQIKKLEFEVDWVGKNQKYETWKVAQDAYKKRLATVELLVFEKEVDALIGTAKQLKPKANSKLAALLQNKVVSQEYVEKVTKEMDALMARRNKNVKSDFAPIPDAEIKKLLNDFDVDTVDGADKRLRGLAASVWNTLTLEERNVLTKYTQTYNYLNEPLRGSPYYGSLKPNADHVRDLPILTNAIAKFKMPQNTVVRRGVNNWIVNELGYGLDKLKPGDVFVDKAFLSTAVHREKGFKQQYNFVIIVPKGAQGFYAEPFSHYTDYHKYTYNSNPKNATLWDGKTTEKINSEQEWIGQRGSQFKVLKKVGDIIYLQLVGQLK